MLKGIDEAVQTTYRLALLDLDGVVYRGKEPVAYSAESITAAEQAGMTVEYTTNNSSRLQATVAQQLQGFGLTVEPWQVITSSVVAARMVAREVPNGAKILVIGAEHLRQEVAGRGLTVVDDAKDEPAAVIQGWYPELSWNELAQASYAVEHGAKYFVTNRDLSIPRELGIAPGCGAFICAVVEATGVEPIASAGKPESAMYDEARLLAAHDGENLVPKEQCIAIGDRLDTDIEAGNRGGYDSLVVLTGVADPLQLMTAPVRLRPSFIARDLRDLASPMPQPLRTGQDEWVCGQDCAILESGQVKVTDVSSVDSLRAACCLVWDIMDNGTQSVDSLELPGFDRAELI